MLFRALLFPLCTFECVERETRGCKGIFGVYNDYNLNDEMNVLNFTVVFFISAECQDFTQ